MKLEIKHLAPYLPCELKVIIMGEMVKGTEYNDKPTPIIFELVGLDTNHVEYHEIGRSVTEQIVFSDCFPILRPLSDLTKEIEHNGEKFVPIFELFKLINDYHLLDFDINYSEKNISFQIDDSWNHIMTFNDIDLQFGYDENDFIFHLTESFRNYSFNYIQMHEKLFEWKFDVFSLIENGLAVAVTDKFNPYK
jgi:hypothetical protein